MIYSIIANGNSSCKEVTKRPNVQTVFEEFEKFCAIVAYGSEGFVTINEFGIAQKLS